MLGTSQSEQAKRHCVRTGPASRDAIGAPATLLAPPGVKRGFMNNSSALMVVSGNFPALDVKTNRVAGAQRSGSLDPNGFSQLALAGSYAAIGGRCWPESPTIVSAEYDTYHGVPG